MNEATQIEEMAKIIKITCNNTFTPVMFATTLYNAGYRKTEEIRKETAKEILQVLYDMCYEYDGRKPDEIVGHIIPLDILRLAKRYGVEVEE